MDKILGNADIKSYFTFLQTKLWTDLQGLLVIALIIGFISSIILQAIKKSDDEIFPKSDMGKRLMQIINGFLNLFTTCVVVLVFDGFNKIYQNILYIGLIWMFSWAIAIISYAYFTKYLFEALEAGGKAFKLLNAWLDDEIKKYTGEGK